MTKTKIHTLQRHEEETEEANDEDYDNEMKSTLDKMVVSLKTKTEQVRTLKLESIKKDAYNEALVNKIKLLGEEINELQRQISGYMNYTNLQKSNTKHYKQTIDTILNNSIDSSLEIVGDELKKYKGKYDAEAETYANDLLKRLNISINR